MRKENHIEFKGNKCRVMPLGATFLTKALRQLFGASKRWSQGDIHLFSYSLAFTMAEILISLTIIGIIAAITLPSLRDNINEKTWATQKKAFYSRMSQALAMMPSLNGYGVDPANNTNTANRAAQAFITDGLSKVLQINNICDRDNLKNCGIQSKYKTAAKTKIDFPITMYNLHNMLAFTVSLPNDIYGSISLINTKAAAFETANGESVAVFYQPNCKYSTDEAGYLQPYLCANFIVDLNGKKGPNTFDRDVKFMSVFYPTDSVVVMPEAYNIDSSKGTTYANALKVCRNERTPDLRLPNREELASIAINGKLWGNLEASGSVYATTNNWKVLTGWLVWTKGSYDPGIKVRCIKR